MWPRRPNQKKVPKTNVTLRSINSQLYSGIKTGYSLTNLLTASSGFILANLGQYSLVPRLYERRESGLVSIVYKYMSIPSKAGESVYIYKYFVKYPIQTWLLI